MLKVVAFISDLGQGGAQGVLVNVCNYLTSIEEIEISVVVQNLNNPVHQDELDKKIKITSFNVTSTKRMLTPLKEYIAKEEFDYAFAFSPEIAVNLVLARKKLKKNFRIIGRCINTLSLEFKHAQTFFRKYVTRALVKKYYHKIDLAVAQSKGMADDLIKNFKFDKGKVVVINNAMNIKFEETATTVENNNKDDNFILYVGRLEHQKGLHMLLESFRDIADKTVSLYLVGSGSEREQLKELAISLNIDDKVNFVEYTKDIMDYLKKARLTVLSSYYEGFPNVLVESIACGTPVVAFDLPSGPKEIIIEGENGYLADYLDCKSLTEKIDSALARSWDEKTIKDTAMRYSRKVIMKMYEELFIK